MIEIRPSLNNRLNGYEPLYDPFQPPLCGIFLDEVFLLGIVQHKSIRYLLQSPETLSRTGDCLCLGWAASVENERETKRYWLQREGEEIILSFGNRTYSASGIENDEREPVARFAMSDWLMAIKQLLHSLSEDGIMEPGRLLSLPSAQKALSEFATHSTDEHWTFLVRSRDFYPEYAANEEDEILCEEFYEVYEDTVARLTEIWGEPDFEGDWETQGFPEWSSAIHIAYWHRNTYLAYVSYEHGDKECPMLVGLGSVRESQSSEASL